MTESTLYFRLEFEGEQLAIAAMDRIGNLNQREAHQQFHRQHYLPEARKRYAQIRARTPYSPRSVGGIKQVSRKRRGYPGDPGFGYDSGTLERQLTTEEGLLIGSDYSEIGSDLHYAPRIHELVKRKGPFPGLGLLFILDADADVLGAFLFKRIEHEWSQ